MILISSESSFRSFRIWYLFYLCACLCVSSLSAVFALSVVSVCSLTCMRCAVECRQKSNKKGKWHSTAPEKTDWAGILFLTRFHAEMKKGGEEEKRTRNAFDDELPRRTDQVGMPQGVWLAD